MGDIILLLQVLAWSLAQCERQSYSKINMVVIGTRTVGGVVCLSDSFFGVYYYKQLNEDALKLSELNHKFKACSIMLGKCSSNFVAVNNADFITRHVSPLG